MQELLHYFKKSKRKFGLVGIKVDLHKAFDKVSWKFLSTVLKNLGFCQTFINGVEVCVFIVSYYIIINASVTDRVFPKCGLRQGDSLSSYLFIICGEVLSILINRAMDADRIKGVKISRGSPAISHLMYADDIVLFWKAFVREVAAMMDCLEKYYEWLGKSINKDKSGFITSKSTHREIER